MPADQPKSILLSSEDIQARVRELAAEIQRDYADDAQLHLVSVLKGAFIFLGDLIRAMDRPVTHRLHGRVELRQGHDLVGRGAACSRTSTPGLEGRNVIIVEDIVDTGLTLSYLQEILHARGAEVAAGPPACSASRRAARST